MTTATALLLALLSGAPASRPDEATRTAGAVEDLAPPVFSSLLGAESLHGGSSLLFWAGLGSVGAGYGQGITALDDLCAQADFDWVYTELLLSGCWRRPVVTMGVWTLAAKLQLGWYLDLGGTWIHAFNRADRGLLIGPAVLLSTHAGDGLVAIAAEVPLTFTRWNGGGFMVGPKLSASYETPLYGDLSLGVSAGLRWRGGGGGAPVVRGRVDSQLLLLMGYRIL
jgi:hypothetical protein